MHLIEQTACELLAQGQIFVLATIFRHEGATPRTAGSKMIVTREGRGIGTIGGGSLEAAVMVRATQLIKREQSEVMHFDLSGDVITAKDMICGGSADVLLACVLPTPVNRDLFGQWQQVLEKNRQGCLVTVALQTSDTLYRTTLCLVMSQEKMIGPVPLGQSVLKKVLTTAQTATRIQTLWFEKALVVVEPSVRFTTAYLFGAGHVAQPTAHLAAMVGFQVWVLDDRKDYVNPERFPEAHRVRLLDSFERAFTDLAITSDSYVIIFTHGHLHDKIVLAQALATDAGYIGMIASRRKRNTIYDALRAEGVHQTQIDRVHSPIGLAIGAETPEEIAVSIVAEMILQRSQRMP
ncbi:MAG: XdhC family aldehyde oxidoreductase maturation factor [Desulfobacterales bacterium]|jgi:xanthine dehydrogenase accessory factor